MEVPQNEIINVATCFCRCTDESIDLCEKGRRFRDEMCQLKTQLSKEEFHDGTQKQSSGKEVGGRPPQQVGGTYWTAIMVKKHLYW